MVKLKTKSVLSNVKPATTVANVRQRFDRIKAVLKMLRNCLGIQSAYSQMLSAQVFFKFDLSSDHFVASFCV